MPAEQNHRPPSLLHPPPPASTSSSSSPSTTARQHAFHQQIAPSAILVPLSTVLSDHPPNEHAAAPGSSGSTFADRISSAHATSLSSLSITHSPIDDIEMDQLSGSAAHSHRRRRSSLMNDILSPTGSRSRTGSIRAPSPQQANISEEDEVNSARCRPDPSAPVEDDDDADLSDEHLQDDEETGLTKKDRKKRRNRRSRNAQLDQRILRERISADEKKEADQSVIQRLAVNGSLIGLWYLFSLAISLYNKWMFDDGKLNFPFPLFTTSMHMVVQFSLASLVLYVAPRFRPQNAGAHGHGHASDMGRSRHESEPADKSPMTRWFYWTRIGPCGAATGLDIGLGNTSLKYITLTFYTMCKSSSLAFVLMFAFLFRLETPTWRLIAVIATMTMGVIMMVAGEVEFKFSGFALVISAAFFSGFRWGLTQILLLRNPATSNPFSSIFYLAPVMFLTLILIAVPSEGLFEFFEGVAELAETHGVLLTPAILLFPGTIAFLMTASEFALLQRTSVVTLSIAGIFKEVLTISVAAIVYDDSLTPINLSGLIVTIGAISAYNYIKITRMREEAQQKVHREHLILEDGAEPGSSGSGSDGDNEGDDNETSRLIAATGRPGPQGLVTPQGDIILEGQVQAEAAVRS